MEQKTTLKNRLTPEQEQARMLQIKAAHAAQKKIQRAAVERAMARYLEEDKANAEPAASDPGGAG